MRGRTWREVGERSVIVAIPIASVKVSIATWPRWLGQERRWRSPVRG
jgi:hypothetical protein